jgi:hypothetical protein
VSRFSRFAPSGKGHLASIARVRSPKPRTCRHGGRGVSSGSAATEVARLRSHAGSGADRGVRRPRRRGQPLLFLRLTTPARAPEISTRSPCPISRSPNGSIGARSADAALGLSISRPTGALRPASLPPRSPAPRRMRTSSTEDERKRRRVSRADGDRRSQGHVSSHDHREGIQWCDDRGHFATRRPRHEGAGRCRVRRRCTAEQGGQTAARICSRGHQVVLRLATDAAIEGDPVADLRSRALLQPRTVRGHIWPFSFAPVAFYALLARIPTRVRDLPSMLSRSLWADSDVSLTIAPRPPAAQAECSPPPDS